MLEQNCEIITYSQQSYKCLRHFFFVVVDVISHSTCFSMCSPYFAYQTCAQFRSFNFQFICVCFSFDSLFSVCVCVCVTPGNGLFNYYYLSPTVGFKLNKSSRFSVGAMRSYILCVLSPLITMFEFHFSKYFNFS